MIHTFIDQVLDQAIESANRPGTANDKEHKAFLPALLGEGRTREDLKYDILNITLAGKDTMASFLSSIWYTLSRRPNVVDSIRNEIGVLDGRAPTKGDLAGFRYLHMVLQEVLRLYPPVAVNQRTAEVDAVLPRGGGADGRDPIFVARAHPPERWLEINPSWAFMPFHAGPRCLGPKLHPSLILFYCTVRLVPHRLIQHFPQIEDRNEKPWEERMGLNVTSRHGVQVAFPARGA
ncbi:cytochrome P450 [Cercophora newfieldiana]|uniref:Cytochrome P450 n=1 Tax=Cercophora newfieldiana TaxID=92897 RepID=A0AA39XX93_9PEZI|nr:cytochrome P450 [Cercophora newfieldiana]